jgi:hypothetical protein
MRDFLKKERPWFANVVKTAFGEIANAQSGSAIDSQSNYVDLITAGGDGLLVDAIVLTSNDSANRVVIISRKVSGTYRPIGAVQILANAGTNGTTASVDALSGAIIAGLPINAQGKRFIRLANGEALAFKVTTAVTNTSGMAVRASVSGTEFQAES